MNAAIVLADLHIRANTPRCRSMDEDWMKTQETALMQVVQQANDRFCDVIIVGDLFHQAKPPQEVVELFIRCMLKVERDVWILAGNHDLPHHNFKIVNESAYGVVSLLFKDFTDKGERENYNYFGISANHFDLELDRGEPILFTHQLVLEKKNKMVEAYHAQSFLDDYENAKLVFTGDNHHGFVYENNGRYVINSGCLTRQSSAFKGYQPFYHYVEWDEDGTLIKLEKILGTDNDPNAVIDDHIGEQNERDGRIAGFIELIKNKGSISLDFVENLRNITKNPDVSTDEKAMLLEIIEEIQ